MIAWMAMTGETAISAWIRTKQNPIWEASDLVVAPEAVVVGPVEPLCTCAYIPHMYPAAKSKAFLLVSKIYFDLI